ncbi:hypothetical protein MASR1M31_02540 [Porphyromonadaceae bacterium]
MESNTINPEISIIIPSYKPNEYLYECLDSIRKQTFNSKQIETIIILNGCKDPYLSELRNYEKQYKEELQLIIFQTNEKGVSNARNHGLKMAKGRFITFIDDDDYISPTYLEEMYSIVLKGITPISNLLAFSKKGDYHPYFISSSFNKNKIKKEANIINLRSYMSVVYCKLIDRDILSNKYFDTRFSNGEDALFMAQLSDKIKYFELTSENAIYYRRIRPNSAVTRKMGFPERLSKSMVLSFAYINLYIKKPHRYNVLFFASRIMAALKGIMTQGESVLLKKCCNNAKNGL